MISNGNAIASTGYIKELLREFVIRQWMPLLFCQTYACKMCDGSQLAKHFKQNRRKLPQINYNKCIPDRNRHWPQWPELTQHGRNGHCARSCDNVHATQAFAEHPYTRLKEEKELRMRLRKRTLTISAIKVVMITKKAYGGIWFTEKHNVRNKMSGIKGTTTRTYEISIFSWKHRPNNLHRVTFTFQPVTPTTSL